MQYPRLHVTAHERLCYSRRRLRAISRLREAGLALVYPLYKEHRLPDSRRLGYRVELPDGSDCYCERLTDVEALAEDYQRWEWAQRQPHSLPISFPAWQRDPMQRVMVLVAAGLWKERPPELVYRCTHVPLKLTPCSWPRCQHPADGKIDGQAMCAPHAWAYGRRHPAGTP